MTSAAPTAWTARAATSTPTEGAAAQPAEPIANTTSPSSNVLRRPRRSPSRPAGTRHAANTIAYAFSTHDSAPLELPGKSSAIDGNAMFTMKRSSWAMNTPRATTVKASRRREGTAIGGVVSSVIALMSSITVLDYTPS